MPQDTLVSFRLEPKLKTAVLRRAKRDDLSFSDALRILLKGYAAGRIAISVKTLQRKPL